MKFNRDLEFAGYRQGTKIQIFFHQMASAGKRKNYIHSITVDGAVMDIGGVVCEEIVAYFRGLYANALGHTIVLDALPFKVLSVDQVVALQSPFAVCNLAVGGR